MISDLEKLLALFVGPYGVIAAMAVALFFLWRLYREALAEGKKAVESMAVMTVSLNALVGEFKQWRESYRDFMLGLAGVKLQKQENDS